MAIVGKGRIGLVLLGALSVLLLATAPASGASLIAKDGKIHACYKVKGKGKGTLRVVRNGKVKCPKKWKKVAWRASGVPGAQGEAGAPGSTGEGGSTGVSGTTGTVVVKQLEDKVAELLGRVQGLEAILSGITNQQLKEAIGSVPLVQSLCTQAAKLTEQSNAMGTAIEGLNTTLGTLVAMFSPVTVPAALPAYSCP